MFSIEYLVVCSFTGTWRRVEALSGREAVLPCEVGALEDSDMIYVVLWYKNGDKEPIYRYTLCCHTHELLRFYSNPKNNVFYMLNYYTYVGN